MQGMSALFIIPRWLPYAGAAKARFMIETGKKKKKMSNLTVIWQFAVRFCKAVEMFEWRVL